MTPEEVMASALEDFPKVRCITRARINVELAIALTVDAIADATELEVLEDLSTRLDRLDTGLILLRSIEERTRENVTI